MPADQPHLVQPAMDKLQRLKGGKGKGSYVFSVRFNFCSEYGGVSCHLVACETIVTETCPGSVLFGIQIQGPKSIQALPQQ